jgi:hypothetical protein
MKMSGSDSIEMSSFRKGGYGSKFLKRDNKEPPGLGLRIVENPKLSRGGYENTEFEPKGA